MDLIDLLSILNSFRSSMQCEMLLISIKHFVNINTTAYMMPAFQKYSSLSMIAHTDFGLYVCVDVNFPRSKTGCEFLASLSVTCFHGHHIGIHKYI